MAQMRWLMGFGNNAFANRIGGGEIRPARPVNNSRARAPGAAYWNLATAARALGCAQREVRVYLVYLPLHLPNTPLPHFCQHDREDTPLPRELPAAGTKIFGRPFDNGADTANWVLTPWGYALAKYLFLAEERRYDVLEDIELLPHINVPARSQIVGDVQDVTWHDGCMTADGGGRRATCTLKVTTWTRNDGTILDVRPAGATLQCWLVVGKNDSLSLLPLLQNLDGGKECVRPVGVAVLDEDLPARMMSAGFQNRDFMAMCTPGDSYQDTGRFMPSTETMQGMRMNIPPGSILKALESWFPTFFASPPDQPNRPLDKAFYVDNQGATRRPMANEDREYLPNAVFVQVVTLLTHVRQLGWVLIIVIVQVVDEALTLSTLSLDLKKGDVLKETFAKNFVLSITLRTLASFGLAHKRIVTGTPEAELEVKQLSKFDSLCLHVFEALLVYFMVPVSLIELPVRLHPRGQGMAKMYFKVKGVRTTGLSYLRQAHFELEDRRGTFPLTAIALCHKVCGLLIQVPMAINANQPLVWLGLFMKTVFLIRVVQHAYRFMRAKKVMQRILEQAWDHVAQAPGPGAGPRPVVLPDYKKLNTARAKAVAQLATAYLDFPTELSAWRPFHDLLPHWGATRQWKLMIACIWLCEAATIIYVLQAVASFHMPLDAASQAVRVAPETWEVLPSPASFLSASFRNSMSVWA